ncbi:hypothetical protein OIU74_015101 [Salix koriyanagi]|uniref:Uncharacterized protein n=1 Tax=Salix koriyanagi TaxID=2511006 RepID=A0A9Q0PXD0_9ROSI|nr:hypothetical protein OIU74_015101 [Salix koriyanagi]
MCSGAERKYCSQVYTVPTSPFLRVRCASLPLAPAIFQSTDNSTRFMVDDVNRALDQLFTGRKCSEEAG